MSKPGRLGGSDTELDQLLARGRLSGAQYDDVEQRVLDRVRPARPPARWRFVAPAAAVAAGLVLWATLKGEVPNPRSGLPTAGESRDAFREKGTDGARLGVVSAGCGDGRSETCRVGETLLFAVTGHAVPVYLSAYAERSDVPGERIWYFPRKGAVAPRVDPNGGTAVLSEGVRLGAPHAKGRYRLKVWLSRSPIERAGVGSLLHDAQIVDIDVVD